MTVSCWKRAWKALAAALRGFLWPDKGVEGATVVPTPSPGPSDDRGKP